MNRTEAKACMRILYAVARTGGEPSHEEMRPIRAVVGAGGVRASEVPPSLDLPAELQCLETPEARQLTLRAALAIATIDGVCTADEHRLLEHLHAGLGDDGAPLPTLEATWMARMVETRRAQDSVTEEFLREIARAVEHGELSTQQYQARVWDLERAKDELVSQVLLSQPSWR